ERARPAAPGPDRARSPPLAGLDGACPCGAHARQ
ncbi:MAG: hypothetical protein AVDCRST_MAG27-3528, partial [uncultured Craurococcus sp.]